jgi:hypothetical protein
VALLAEEIVEEWLRGQRYFTIAGSNWVLMRSIYSRLNVKMKSSLG